MANLAIKGHTTRGNEVIEILEMLSGENKYNITTLEENLLYTIRKGDNVIIATYRNSDISSIFTLEEFLEDYPYKIGDKVLINDNKNDVYTVKSMIWNENFNQVDYEIESVEIVVDNYTCFAHELVFSNTKKEEIVEEKLEQITLDIPDGYEFFGVNDENKVVLTKKQPQYPKTYEECCEVLNLGRDGKLYTKGYKSTLIQLLQKLIVCRDAYWKIAGEEMGLDGPWEPDWPNNHQKKYTICFYQGKISLTTGLNVHSFLAFPTEEMRNAFFENFKDLIVECEEFL